MYVSIHACMYPYIYYSRSHKHIHTLTRKNTHTHTHAHTLTHTDGADSSKSGALQQGLGLQFGEAATHFARVRSRPRTQNEIRPGKIRVHKLIHERIRIWRNRDTYYACTKLSTTPRGIGSGEICVNKSSTNLSTNSYTFDDTVTRVWRRCAWTECGLGWGKIHIHKLPEILSRFREHNLKIYWFC